MMFALVDSVATGVVRPCMGARGATPASVGGSRGAVVVLPCSGLGVQRNHLGTPTAPIVAPTTMILLVTVVVVWVVATRGRRVVPPSLVRVPWGVVVPSIVVGLGGGCGVVVPSVAIRPSWVAYRAAIGSLPLPVLWVLVVG